MISHVVPDADALGSMFAMARAWDSDARNPVVALPAGSLSQRLSFMFEQAGVQVADDDAFARADGFVVLDTAKLPRCNVGKERKEGDWVAGRPLINIDHHNTNTQFGSINWVEPTATSTAEIVYRLLCAAHCPIDATTASLLFAGIHTDSIGFSLPTTTADALEAAAQLVRLGADVADIGERVCFSQRKSEFDLLRVIYANTRIEADGLLAYSTVTFDEIHGAGCTAADIDDQINIVRALDGVKLAILFSEGRKGKTRLNFRGSGNVTVVELAQELGGGGHAQAAGTVLECGVDEAVRQVVPRAVEHVRGFAGT